MRSKLCLVLSIFLFIFPANLLALDFNDLKSKHVLVYDSLDDNIIYNKDSESKASVASLGKLMTLLVTIENTDDITKKANITQEYLDEVPWDASQLYISAYDELTIEDLLHATLINSAADAAILLSHNVFNSQAEFINEMNRKAKELKMDTTKFENVIGFDHSDQYSSADDLLKLLKYSLDNKTFKEVFTTLDYTMSNGKKLNHTLNNYNSIMNIDLSMINGAKTGFTDDADYCLAFTFNAHDRDFIAITLGAKKTDNFYNHINDAKIIIDTIQNRYENNISFKNKIITKIPIVFGKDNFYNVTMTNDPLFLPKNFDKNLLEFNYEGIKEINEDNINNSKLGTINIYYDKQIIKSVDAKINQEVEFSFLKKLFSYKITYAVIIAFLIFGIFQIRFNKRV